MKVLVTQSCPALCNPMNCSPPGSSVHEFSRQEYWTGFAFPSPRDLPNPGTEPGSCALQADSLPFDPPGKPHFEAIYIFQSTGVSIFSAEIYRLDISSHKDKEFK